MTLLESDPIILDDEVFEIRCDKRRPDCTVEADWIITCRRCSNPTFLCDRHYRYLRAASVWTCLSCAARSLRFEDIADVTPLNP